MKIRGFSVLATASVLLLAFCQSAPVTNKRSPVILIPGLGGTQIWAKLNKPSTRNFLCQSRTSEYFLLWLRPESLVYPFILCFIDNIRLQFNPATNKTTNSPGVSIKIPNFGNTSSVEYLSNVKITLTSYFYNLVNRLVTKMGYVRGVSVRGAPFDYRKAPNEYQAYFGRLQQLIEETYTLNNNTPVTLVGHSLGCLTSYRFLLSQSQAWKDQYIDSFVSIVGPFGGTSRTILAETSGDPLNIPIVKGNWVRESQRSWPSTAYLLPSSTAWKPTEVIAKTSKRNYTVQNYQQFFDDIGYPLGYKILQSVESIRDHTTPPGVKTFCLLGKGVDTPDVLDWTKKSFPDDAPTILKGDGDGTVNWRSQEICSQWAGKQSQPVITKVYQGQEHLGLIRTEEFAQHMSNILKTGTV